jgi:hypothetical protein
MTLHNFILKRIKEYREAGDEKRAHRLEDMLRYVRGLEVRA